MFFFGKETLSYSPFGKVIPVIPVIPSGLKEWQWSAPLIAAGEGDGGRMGPKLEKQSSSGIANMN